MHVHSPESYLSDCESMSVSFFSCVLNQIKGSSGLLSKITFTGEDSEFLVKRQQALEV